MKDIRIATAICRSCPFEVERNFETTSRLVRAAKAQGVSLICFPEMNLTGYTNNPEIHNLAERVPGPLSSRLADLAAREDMVILAGMAERNGSGEVFVAHLVASPNHPVEIYRKIHTPPPEQQVFTPGGDLPLFERLGIRFGIQLCYDAHFPELSTLTAQMGADLIFVPHASPRGTADEKFHSWMRHLPARAYDNSLFVAACNPSGETEKGLNLPGLALLIDPSGNIRSRVLDEEEGLMIADLKAGDIQRVREHKMRFFFPNRRPKVYERIKRRLSLDEKR